MAAHAPGLAHEELEAADFRGAKLVRLPVRPGIKAARAAAELSLVGLDRLAHIGHDASHGSLVGPGQMIKLGMIPGRASHGAFTGQVRFSAAMAAADLLGRKLRETLYVIQRRHRSKELLILRLVIAMELLRDIEPAAIHFHRRFDDA